MKTPNWILSMFTSQEAKDMQEIQLLEKERVVLALQTRCQYFKWQNARKKDNNPLKLERMRTHMWRLYRKSVKTRKKCQQKQSEFKIKHRNEN